MKLEDYEGRHLGAVVSRACGWCGDVGPEGFVCTKPRGHVGAHAAYESTGCFCYAAWGEDTPARPAGQQEA